MCIGVKVDDAALLTSSHSLRQLTIARHSSPQLAATGHSSRQLATARHSLPQLATACQSLPRLTTAYHSSPQLAATGHSWPQLATAHTTALLQRCAPSHRAQQPARLTCTQAAAWAEGLWRGPPALCLPGRGLALGHICGRELPRRRLRRAGARP